jgi:hypothetical protein
MENSTMAQSMYKKSAMLSPAPSKFFHYLNESNITIIDQGLVKLEIYQRKCGKRMLVVKQNEDICLIIPLPPRPPVESESQSTHALSLIKNGFGLKKSPAFHMESRAFWFIGSKEIRFQNINPIG